MLAIVTGGRKSDGTPYWEVVDGTSDDCRHCYCTCDLQENAEMIAASLNAMWRMREAGRLVAKAVAPERNVKHKEK